MSRRLQVRSTPALFFGVWATLLSSAPVDLQAVQAPAQRPDGPVVITHVTVIDVVTGARLPDRTVLLRDRHIASLDTAGRIRVPGNARRVDARGQFLIPGLWDMHGHFGGDRFARGNTFPLFIANGVTGARDM